MEKLELTMDCYHYYDRLGEGLEYHYSVAYDWSSILENDFNQDNFKVIPNGFKNSAKLYFDECGIHYKTWEKQLKKAVLDPNNDIVQNDFLKLYQ